MFAEYLTINNETNRVELRELTDVMCENLSEIATVIACNFVGDTTTVWSERVAHEMHVDRSALLELKRRAVWRDTHLGWVS